MGMARGQGSLQSLLMRHFLNLLLPGAVFVQENVEFLIQELRRPKYSIYFICKYVPFHPKSQTCQSETYLMFRRKYRCEML